MTDDGGQLPQLHILLLERNPEHAARIRRRLLAMEPGVRVTVHGRLRAGLRTLARATIGCVVSDLVLEDAAGIGIVRALRAARRDLPVVVVTAAGSEERAVAAMKLGVADYLPKHGAYLEALPAVVGDALGRTALARAAAYAEVPPVDGAGSDPPFVGTTPAMHAVWGLVERAARSRVPVLIDGETGTGKELVARAIHQRGPARGAPFLVQNCAALPESLLESELFGHVRGAFTGAERARRGLFEEAGDGTVFLDEVGEAPLPVQARLLRVLQHGEAKAVGADTVRAVRARIVAATNRRLEVDSRTGRFRPDLYYRLAVFPIRLPPLRHRAPDIAPLAAHFLRRFEAHERRATGGLDPAALRCLQAYAWPGNVRELQNEMHRLVLSVGDGRRIGPADLARRIREARPAARDAPLEHVLRRVEIALIRERLHREPSKTAAAQSLGITREALYAKMRRLGLAAAGAGR